MNAALRNLLVTVVVIVVIVLGVMLWARHANAPGVTAGQNATSTGVDLTYTGSSTPTVAEAPSPSAPAAPNYKSPLVFSAAANVPADIQVDINSEFATTTATIASDPTNFDAWVKLGTLRKMAGDYQGAATDWAYVTQLYPSSSVGWENLGELYLDFIKNYPKSEADFKQAIAVNPQDDNAYESLVALYTTYGYGTTAEAQAVITQGLKSNPQDPNLLQLQSQLSAQ